MPTLERPLVLAAPSFVNELLLPALAPTGLSVRAVSLLPEPLGRLAGRGQLDLVVAIGAAPPLAAWTSEPVTELVHALFASPGRAAALGAYPDLADIVAGPFVAPVYASAEGLVGGEDRCPIGRDRRRVTHEVVNVRLACRVAAEADLFVYGPVAAAAPFVEAGTLVEIAASGRRRTRPASSPWTTVKTPCRRVDRGSASTARVLTALGGGLLAAMTPGASHPVRAFVKRQARLERRACLAPASLAASNATTGDSPLAITTRLGRSACPSTPRIVFASVCASATGTRSLRARTTGSTRARPGIAISTSVPASTNGAAAATGP